MADKRKVQLEVGMDVSGVESGADRGKNAVSGMVEAVKRSGEEAGRGLDDLGSKSDASSAKVQRAYSRLESEIRRVTAAAKAAAEGTGKSGEILNKALAQGLDVSKIEPALAKLRELELQSSKATKVAADGLHAMHVSAKQTEWALRGIPAQLTDIIVSLQGGQHPLTVLLQQGGQLKDMFGGAGAAARAMGGFIAGLVTPYTLAAAAAGGLAAAYYKSSQEADGYTKALVLTGNAAGVTAVALAEMAKGVASSSGGSRGSAAAVLTEIASSGKIAAEQMGMVADAALRMERVAGVAASETVKQFIELAKSPAEASAKLNESTNFLTASIYQQIKALEDQGRTAEAASLALQSYYDAEINRVSEIEAQFGALQRVWQQVKSDASAVADAILSIGRPDTAADKIASLRSQIGERERGGVWSGWRSTDAMKSELKGLEDQIALEKEIARAKAESSAREKAKIEWANGGADALSKQEKMEREILKVRALAKAAGADSLEVEKRIAAIREKYKEKPAGLSDHERAYKSATAAAQDYIAKISAQAQAEGELTEGERMLLRLRNDLTAKDYERVKSMVAGAIATEKQARQTKEAAKAADELAKAEAAAARERGKMVDAANKEAAAQGKAADMMREQVETLGMGTQELAAYNARKLDAAANAELHAASELNAAAALLEVQGTLPEVVRWYRDLAEARQKAGENLQLQRDLAIEEGVAKASNEARKAWQKTAEDIEKSITDSLMRGFESGKGFAENLRDTIVNMFKTLVLRPVVQFGVQGALSAVGLGSLSGAANAAQTVGGAGGLLNAGSSVMNLFGSGAGSVGWGVGQGMISVGNATGWSGLANFGVDMAAGQGFAGMLGTAMPWIGAALAVASLFGKRGGPKFEGSTLYDFADDSFKLPSTVGGEDRDRDGGRAYAEQISMATLAGVEATINSLGGDASTLAARFGFNRDGKGDAPQNIGTSLYKDGSLVYQAYNDYGREDAEFAKGVEVELKRLTVAAIGAADGLPPVFGKIVRGIDLVSASSEQLDAVLAQLSQAKTILDYSNFDPFEAYDKALKAQESGLTGAWDTQRQAVEALVKTFDGGADATAKLAAGIQTLAEIEAQAVAYINQSIAALRSNTQADAEGMYLGTLDNKAQYDYRIGLSQRLEDQLATAQSPEQIMALYEKLRGNYQSAYGLLDETQQAAEGSKYFGRLNSETGQFEGGYLGDLQAQVEAMLAPFGQTLADAHDLADPDSLAAQIQAAFGNIPDSLGTSAGALVSAAGSLQTVAGALAGITGVQPAAETIEAPVLAIAQSVTGGMDAAVTRFLDAAARMDAAAARMEAATATPLQVQSVVTLNAIVAPGVEVNA